MTPADFEESEYRGPLYNQLERGNHLVWEPGQVFEKYIGIDRATLVTDPYFWGLHGLSTPMPGVVLLDYDWSFIWRERLRPKVLPDFRLNLFLQAKRPQAGTRPRGKIREAGILADYWKFSITPHQQIALQAVSETLSGQAMVCYAAPAFHTQAALYEHTKNQSIVATSTFPSVDVLAGHGAWYYNAGGVFGVANPDFVRIDVEPLQSRIVVLVESSSSRDRDPEGSLRDLAAALAESASGIEVRSPADTWFQQLVARSERAVAMLEEMGDRDQARLSALRHFGQVKAFCYAYRLDWYVLGRGG